MKDDIPVGDIVSSQGNNRAPVDEFGGLSLRTAEQVTEVVRVKV
jgi:hypothetical protein